MLDYIPEDSGRNKSITYNSAPDELDSQTVNASSVILKAEVADMIPLPPSLESVGLKWDTLYNDGVARLSVCNVKRGEKRFQLASYMYAPLGWNLHENVTDAMKAHQEYYEREKAEGNEIHEIMVVIDISNMADMPRDWLSAPRKLMDGWVWQQYWRNARGKEGVVKKLIAIFDSKDKELLGRLVKTTDSIFQKMNGINMGLSTDASHVVESFIQLVLRDEVSTPANPEP